MLGAEDSKGSFFNSQLIVNNFYLCHFKKLTRFDIFMRIGLQTGVHDGNKLLDILAVIVLGRDLISNPV